MKYFPRLPLSALFCICIAISTNVSAKDPVYTSFLSNKAIQGYDSVSYFQGDGIPVEGSDDFQTEWRGATWYFSSAENLQAFQSQPEKYAPQYGGYCAWAAAHDSLAKGDPLIYEIVGDKLYLNYNERIGYQWSPRKEELIPVADEKYPELVDLN